VCAWIDRQRWRTSRLTFTSQRTGHSLAVQIRRSRMPFHASPSNSSPKGSFVSYRDHGASGYGNQSFLLKRKRKLRHRDGEQPPKWRGVRCRRTRAICPNGPLRLHNRNATG